LPSMNNWAVIPVEYVDGKKFIGEQVIFKCLNNTVRSIVEDAKSPVKFWTVILEVTDDCRANIVAVVVAESSIVLEFGNFKPMPPRCCRDVLVIA
jgi:hypothetical protein